jgi:hypothetical protein
MITTTREVLIHRAQAEWALGRLPARTLPEFALEAMRRGYRGPSLLAMADSGDPEEISDEIVEGAFREMGLEPITALEAVRRLARTVAERILHGHVSPAAGAEEISSLMRRFDRGELPSVLAEFRWGSDGAKRRLTDAQRIVELAWLLLEDSD